MIDFHLANYIDLSGRYVLELGALSHASGWGPYTLHDLRHDYWIILYTDPERHLTTAVRNRTKTKQRYS